jgi:hypothetical protein
MSLTRSKRKALEEKQTPNKIKVVELVKPNKTHKNVIHQKNSEPFALKIQETVLIKPSLTQINASQASSQATPTPDDAISMFIKVRKVLEQNFKNVQERLELDRSSTPQCLFDSKECTQYHSSKSQIDKASESSTYIARTYLSEERHFQFFHFVRHNLCGLGQFPGSEICIKVLQEILVSGLLSINYHVTNSRLSFRNTNPAKHASSQPPTSSLNFTRSSQPSCKSSRRVVFDRSISKCFSHHFKSMVFLKARCK